MTEPMRATPIPQESEAYQPVSGWAIAGLTIGVLFALLTAVTTIVGYFQGAPVFFPLWIMVIPIGGVILSLIGQQQVQNSEGTRAGLLLARAGLWFGLLSGISYFSYYYFTGFAVQSQADDFLRVQSDEDSGFFPLVREGAKNPTQMNAAFLLTLPASSRNGKPENEREMRKLHDGNKDGQPGHLTQFKGNLFGRLLFGDLATGAEIKPLAVQDWVYEKRSYKIRRPYRIRTREVEIEIVVTVQSTEAEAGASRKWFVNMAETYPAPNVPKKLSKTGEGVRLLRGRAQKKLDDWLNSLKEGEPLPAAVFPPDEQTLAEQIAPADTLPSIVQTLLDRDNKRLANPMVLSREDDVGKWEQIDGKIRIYLSFRVTVVTKTAGQFNVFAYAALDTRQDINPDEFGTDSPAPDWEVTRIGLFFVGRVLERKG